jgi:glycosyltransferase involved in cell wall biosynthesis
MACGIPVVASTADALVEVGGAAALYAGPRDIEALSRQLERALEDGELRARLREAGPRRAARVTWDDAAERTALAIAEAAETAA